MAAETRTKSLRDMQEEATAWCHANGWYDEPVPFPLAVALLHSEVSEALEAWRQWGTEDATMPVAHLDGTGNLDGPPKPEGVGSEFADLLIRLLDYAHRFGVDLEAEYRRKMAFNQTRPYRHGKRA